MKRLRCKLAYFGTSGRSCFNFKARFKGVFIKLPRKEWLFSGSMGDCRPSKERRPWLKPIFCQEIGRN